jgi:CHAT domain/MalT-like TPR region
VHVRNECHLRGRRLRLCIPFFLVALAGVPASGQQQLTTGKSLELSLEAKQAVTLTIQGQPGAFANLELSLLGGLISVASPGLPPWPIELGKGGRAQYVVQLLHDGSAQLEVRSREVSRTAGLQITLLDVANTPELARLYQIEGYFLKAESARRHLPAAPDPKTALEDFDQAIALSRQINDIPLLRLVMTEKARYLLFNRSELAPSRALLLQASGLPAADDLPQQALTAKTASSAETFLGNYDSAIVEGDRALALYRQTGDQYWQGIVLENLISDYDAVGEPEKASEAAREALDDAKAVHDFAGIAFTLSQLAAVDRERGDLQGAFQSFRDAMVWGEQIHYAPLVQADFEKELGSFYAELGMWEEAEEQLRSCLAHIGEPETPTSLEARGLLARILEQRGQHRKAMREYDLAIPFAAKLQAPREGALLLLGRSTARAADGDKSAAAKDAEQAAQLANDLQAPALLVKVALARGAAAETPADSLRAYRSALALAEKTGQREEQSAALAGCTRAQLELRDVAGGLASIDDALQLVERAYSTLETRDIAGSYIAEHRAWYELAIHAAMRQAAHEPGKGYEEMAFAWGERARARSLLDSLGKRGWGPSIDLPPAMRRQAALNRHAIEEQQAALEKPHANTLQIAAKLRNLYHEQAALEAEQRAYVQGHGLAGGRVAELKANRVVSVSEVQQKLLDPQTAVVEFYVGQQRSYRWLLTQRAIVTTTLPGCAKLQQSLATLLAALAARRLAIEPGEDAGHYAERQHNFRETRDSELQRAGSLFLGNLPAEIRRLYIVADGPLLSLPWSALRIPCGRRTCYAVERYAIESAPSASVALSLSGQESDTSRQGIVVVANGGAAGKDNALLRSDDPPLAGSQREAHLISKLATANAVHMLIQSDASPAMVRTIDSNEFDILHIAAHTVLVVNHPEFSGIALTSGPADMDGVLWLRDISSMHAPRLVVLSGCKTEGDAPFTGESIQSLAQAFFFAGARQVVGSLWSVDDDATAKLMRQFYSRLLKRHMMAADALRGAQLVALNTGTDLSMWSAFLVNGVEATRPPDVVIQKETP